MAEENIAMLELGQITDPKFLLRYVDRNTVVYVELLDSIRQHGLHQSLLVRPHPNGTPDLYELVEGNWRLNCCRDLGRSPVPAIIRDLTDEEVLTIQIQANALRPETTKTDFARQLRRIQQYRPGVSISELARLINKNPSWIKNQLDLLELDEATQRMVDDGEMPLSSAYMLAKVPRIHRTDELVAQACVLPAVDFKLKAAAIIKAFMEEVRQGRLAHHYNDKPFAPVAHQRGIKHVKAEIESPYYGPEIIVAENLKNPLDIWKAALRWTVHLDAASLEEQRRRLTENRPQRNLKNLYEREPDELTPE